MIPIVATIFTSGRIKHRRPEVIITGSASRNPIAILVKEMEIMVESANQTTRINIFPNLITDAHIGMAFKRMNAGIYHLQLFNSNGQVFLNKIVTHTAGTLIIDLQPFCQVINYAKAFTC